MLEFQQAHLFEILLDTSPQKANNVFYRITNKRSCYSIIDSLLSLHEDDAARKFWSKIEKKMNPIDQFRNNLVHWVPIADMGNTSAPQTEPSRRFLQPGHSICKTDAASLSTEDILEKKEVVDQLTLIITIFSKHIKNNVSGDKAESLREIYLQPITDQTAMALAQCQIPTKP